MNRTLALAAIVLVALTAGAPTVAALTRVVEAFNFGYRDTATNTPATAIVLGDAVQWRNLEGTHTATAGASGIPAGTGPSSPVLSPGGSYTWTPGARGVYPYTCIFHASMNGVIVVR